MFETVFTLKQHTPILHFLHDQDGATLRATELKPKLDRFILEQKKGKIPDDWILSEHEGHKALDYKLKIKPVGKKLQAICLIETNHPSSTIKQFPQVLANVGVEDTEEAKELLFYGKHEATASTWHPELLQAIEDCLPKLLAQTTFGNRSSKGFGSFSCTQVGDTPIKAIPELAYLIEWRVPATDRYGNKILDHEWNQHRLNNLFEAISCFYRCIRSGINQVNRDKVTELYFKSLLYLYAKNLNPNEPWDKYNIKNHFFEGGHLTENPADYRDWLGLSTDELWKRKQENREGRIWYKDYQIKKESLNKEIDRFPSPILFKPEWDEKDKTLCHIYFGVNLKQELADQFKETQIKVICEKKKKDRDYHDRPDYNITPLTLTISSKFNLDEYLKFVFGFKANIQKHVEQGTKGKKSKNFWRIYENFISPIFNNLQQNPHANHGK